MSVVDRLVERGPEVVDEPRRIRDGHPDLGEQDSGFACPAEVARFYPWPDLVYPPVLDAPPCRWAFAWHTANTNPLIRAFVEPADVGAGQGDATSSAEEPA
jgi:hypothetical protein